MGSINSTIKNRLVQDQQIICDFFNNKISLISSDYTNEDEFKDSLKSVISVLASWSTNEIINLLSQSYQHKAVASGDVPQFSDFSEAAYTTPRRLDDHGQKDVSYVEMGKLLAPHTKKEDGAHMKYGENHAKTAALLGLTTVIDGKINLSDFGRFFLTLNQYLQAALIPSLCLQVPILYNYFCQKEKWESIEDDMTAAALSDSTKGRRRSNIRAMIDVVKNGFEIPTISKKTLKISSISGINNKFITAIRTKPFLLLAGISGTGKSQVVKEMAFATCPNIDELRKSNASPGNYCLIEVKPNWHDSTELLGYDSAIKNHYVVTKFVKFVAKAMRYPEVPFFVCLDEMNLAPVEQYFAEFLSVLESRKLVNGTIISEPLISHEAFNNDLVAKDLFDLQLPSVGEMHVKSAALSDADLGDNSEIWHLLKDDGLCIPQNLIVIGTVNMDETTHQFSRKVIDRAMTFEMNEANFVSYFEDKVTLNYVDKPLDANRFFAHNVSGNKAMEEFKTLDGQFKANVSTLLNALNEALDDTPFKIAYRVQNELILYFTELLRENADAKLATAFDDIMMMKVLPRIEGDDELLGNRSSGALHNLKDFAEQHDLTKSIDKIEEMLKRLERSHFTSFWP